MKNKKNDNIIGYILGFVFGLLFSMPWLLCYLLFNLSILYLSFLIVIGIIIGYKLGNKKIYNNKITRIYLILSSVSIIILNIWLFMPIIMKYDYDNIKLILLINTIISSFMVIIPALLLPIDFKKNINKKSESEEFLDKLEKVFEKYDAFSPDKAVDKKIIKEEIKGIEISNIKRLFYTDIIKGFKIKNTKGKWYYKKTKNNFKIGALLALCTLIIFTVLCNIILQIAGVNKILGIDEDNYRINTLEKSGLRKFNIDDKLVLEMPDCMKYYTSNYDEGQNRYYYQYLSRNVNKSNIEVVELYYYGSFDVSKINDKFYENIKKNIEKYNIINEEVKTINNKNINYYKLDNLDKKRYVNTYYIPYDNSFFEVYIYISKNKYQPKDDEITDKIIESLKIYNENVK